MRLNRPEEKLSETVILGHGAEAAPAVVELLKELGLWPKERRHEPILVVVEHDRGVLADASLEALSFAGRSPISSARPSRRC